MKKRFIRLLALVLTAGLLLTGCAGWDPAAFLQQLGARRNVTPYAEMVYTRPDMTALQQALSDACEKAKGDNLNEILDGVYAFYDEYNRFYTNYCLANIKYCADLTDIYWEQENTYCVEHSLEADAALEELYMALAKSPCRAELESENYFGPGYFDAYEGESIWDETFTALVEKETALQNRYYELSEQALEYIPGSGEYYSACGGEMAELLAELIAVRQEMAAWAGYADYVSFAYDFYYYRDYTPQEAEVYLDGIRQQLSPLYRDLAGRNIWEEFCTPTPEAETYDYVRQMAKNMGGIVEDAFSLMDQAGLYDISYGENKYNSSFETYLTYYQEPFIFLNPYGDTGDKLDFAHEFGHFCNDYACFGTYAGVDVAEIFSQGMEYLSLCYGEDTGALTSIKMADSLCTYVEQGAFAAFEQRIYGLTGEDLTAESLYELYGQVATEFGLDACGYDRREFVTITHFYTNPMYIISYVVSNDAALQLYQLEQAEPGAGLKLYMTSLGGQESQLQEYLTAYGLESPFAEGRLQAVRETFETVLG